MENWETIESREPFFLFLFFDSSHYSFFFPPAYKVFQPIPDYVDPEKISQENKEYIKEIRNRYLNALRYEDHLTEVLFRFFQEKGVLDRSYLLVTSDHGQEFYEYGDFGHNGNFSPAQVEVPFLLLGPRIVPGEVTFPTSALDVPLTLLLLNGWKGVEKFFPFSSPIYPQVPSHRPLFLADWDHYGFYLPPYVYRFPRTWQGRKEVFFYDTYYPVEDPEVIAKGEEIVLKKRKEILSAFPGWLAR